MSERETVAKWLSEKGEGVIESGHGLVRLPDLLPGERVRSRSDGRGWTHARISDAPERVSPGCPVFGACGGCTVRHASAALQGATREDLLRRALKRTLGDATVRYLPSPVRDRWRVRARLQWVREGGAVRLGFFARASHAVVDLPGCPVLTPMLEEVLPALRRGLGDIARRGEVALAQGRGGPVVCVFPESQPDARGYLAAEALCAQGFVGVALRPPGAQGSVWGDARPVVRAADGGELVTAMDGFTQSNDAVNALLGDEVLALLGAAGRDVFEFHAGAGNFTVALARTARKVTALESDAEAVAALRENLTARGLTNVTVRHESDEAVRGPVKADAVLLDPPRTGARAVAEVLARHPVRSVVYVSCDPATLARDLEVLQAAYTVRAVTALEMFPHTLHVETVVRLERRGGAVLRSRG
ncbi:MAG: RsmD family RNA methyltransferase [Polyangiales bacterium]